jgi:hypothetical protein
MRRFSLGLFVFFAVFGVSFFLYFEAKAQPAFPTGSSATPLSACQVQLDWTQNEPGAYYFEYQRDFNSLFTGATPFRIPPSGNLSGAPVPAVGGGSTDFSTSSSDGLKKLFSDTTYYYRVRSCDPSSCSQYGNFTSVTTPTLPTVPGAPVISDLTAFQVSSVQDIEFSWATSTLQTPYGGFSVYMSTDGGGFVYQGNTELWTKNADGTLNNDRGTAALSFRINGLSLDSTYTFMVRAYDTAMNCLYDPGLPPASNPGLDPNDPANNNQIVYSADSNQVIVPVRPTNLAGTSSGGPSPVVDLTWNDNSDNESNFEIQKSGVSDFSSLIETLSAPADSTSLSDSNVNPNATYYYRMRTCSASSPAGCSIFSNSVAVATGLSTPTLGASIIYATSSSETATVYLSWAGVIGADQYTIERSVSDIFDSPVTVVTSSGGGFFYERNLPLNQQYYYRVKAEGGGQISYSAIEPINLNIEFVLEGVGWAYGDGGGIGWVKFNSASEGGSTVSNPDYNYSVQIDRDGLLTGVAWADRRGTDDFGWLSFNKTDLAGCPGAPCEARMDEATGALSGWGRFLGPVFDIQDGTYESAFEGWVHLSGSNYGASFDEASLTFSGAAWAGDVGGWLVFGSPECLDCTVRVGRINRLPSVSNVSVEGPVDSWCAASPFYRVRWDYSDPDGDSQQSAEIKFIKVSDDSVAFSDTLSGLEGGQDFYTFFDPLADLEVDESHKARVVVSDGIGDSLPAESGATTTPTHYYPLVSFTTSPDPTATGTITTFTDTSSDRSGGTYPLAGREWTFENSSPGTSANPQEFVVFNDFPSTVTLDIEDSSGVSCIAEQEVGGGGASGPLKRRIFRER